MRIVKRWFQELVAQDRRKAQRQALPGLVAYYWNGGAPEAHSIQEISTTGMYLLTEQVWYLGTLVTMTLQRTDSTDGDPERSIAVQAKVVRYGKDGIGLAFVLPKVQNSQTNMADRKALDKFLQRFLANQDIMNQSGK